MRVGIAHHFGWAVVVTASNDLRVVDRRRIELIEPGLPAAPIHHVGGAHDLYRRGEPLDDEALEALVGQVRACVRRVAAVGLDALAASLPEPILSISLRDWPTDFPQHIAVQRRPPHESRADSIMYRQVFAELARARRWTVHRYGNDVEQRATAVLGERAHDVLHGPRATLGAPWTRDHRVALAATVMAARDDDGVAPSATA